MRVGMEKAPDQNLVEISPEEFLGQRCTIEFHPRQRTHLCNLDAGHVFHGQDTRGAVIADRRGYYDAFEIPELFAERAQVARFLPIIEFAQQALAKLL